MSLYGAIITGVSGLTAQSEALSIASSNIANTDTVGYKSDSTQFSRFSREAASSRCRRHRQHRAEHH